MPTSESTLQVEVMYFGRPSEFLLMTSERLDIPEQSTTLAGVMDRLRARGARWAYELDDRHVYCTINQVAAVSSDLIKACDEITIFSRKSIFEP